MTKPRKPRGRHPTREAARAVSTAAMGLQSAADALWYAIEHDAQPTVAVVARWAELVRLCAVHVSTLATRAAETARYDPTQSKSP